MQQYNAYKNLKGSYIRQYTPCMPFDEDLNNP